MANATDAATCESSGIDKSPIDITDTQARYIIIRNFYEEVTSLILKRFFLICWFRASGEELEESNDILFQILEHLQLPASHILKKNYKYKDQLYLQGKKFEPRKNVDILKFDLSITLAFLEELDYFPSSKNHGKTCCIFCEESCKMFRLGSAQKKQCSNCGFCSTSGKAHCYGDKLRASLKLAKCNRDAGAHSSQSQCSSFPLSAADIRTHIDAITFLYEYLYTINIWRNFNNDWVDHDTFTKIKKEIELIEDSPIEFLEKKFRKRLPLEFRVLTEISDIKKILMKQNPIEKLEMSIQLCVSSMAAQRNLKLKEFLKNAEVHLLESRMKKLIKDVISEEVKKIILEAEIKVRVHKLFKIRRVPSEEEHQKVQVEINIHSTESGVFDDYDDIDEPKSEFLKEEIKKSFYEELKKEVSFNDECEISLDEIILGFETWKIGSLHIILTLSKRNGSTFNDNQVQTLMKVINDVLQSKHEFLKAEFGKSVQFTTKACSTMNVIERFICDVEVDIATGNSNSSYESINLSELSKRIKILLIEKTDLKESVEVTTSLGNFLIFKFLCLFLF